MNAVESENSIEENREREKKMLKDRERKTITALGNSEVFGEKQNNIRRGHDECRRVRTALKNTRAMMKDKGEKQ